MIPAFLISLNTLPLNASGKIDYLALPAPHITAKQPYTAHHTDEKVLVAIWQSVLGLQEIPKDTSFYALGGDSIAAIQVSQQARDHGLPISVEMLSEYPSIEALVEQIPRLSTETYVDLDQIAPPDRDGVLHPGDFPLAALTAKELALIVSTYADQRIQDIYALSPVQQGILLHTLQAPHTGMYVSQVRFTIQGTFHLDLFRQAWQQAIDHFDLLRTGFVSSNVHEPVQVLLSQATLPLTFFDLSQTTPTAQQSKIQGYADNDQQQDIDLSSPPLIRIACFKCHATQHHVVYTDHHIINGGWSKSLLFQTVLNTYQQLLSNQAINLPKPLAFRRYIAWLAQQDQSAAQAYWQKLLQHFSSPVRLDIDRVRADQSSAKKRQATLHAQLSTKQSAMLHTIAARLALSVNTLLQAVWSILLAKYSGQDDIVFGSVLSGRGIDLQGITQMYGLFIYTIPVRAPLSADLSGEQLAQRLHHQFHQSQPYAYHPLTAIQQCARLPASRALFEYSFGFYQDPMDRAHLQASPFSIEALHIHNTVHFPLTLLVSPGEAFSLDLLYDPDRFAASAIAQFMEHFSYLLDQVLSNPALPISQLKSITPTQAHQILVQWNQTQQPLPKQATLHQLFEQQVLKNPQQIALTDGKDKLTYQALNQQANQLAHYIHPDITTPEMLVMIALPRSLSMMVAMLAVLKAGGAYLLLDQQQSTPYLKKQLKEMQPGMIIGHHDQRDTLTGAPIFVALDTLTLVLAKAHQENLNLDIDPHRLAYLIYTSGSTGQPKAVMIEQAGIVNTITQAISALTITPDSHCLVNASVNFDAFVWELYSALLAGASAYLASNQDFSLHHPQITHATLTPSVVQSMDIASLSQLHVLVLIGESCSETLWHLLRHTSTTLTLFNAYGPAEASICSTIYPSQPQHCIAYLGKPIPNTTCFVLDSYQQPVPIGVMGELYVGGIGVARGYVNQPELTAARFIEHPIIDDQPMRLYRTGDLVRWTPEGLLEFIGRKDQQIQLKGQRIEPAEIQEVILSHAAIKHAVVIKQPTRDGSEQLVAYCVPHQTLQETPSPETGIKDWETLNDRLYANNDDPFVGWHSRYTGKPIPAVEMQAWLDATIDLITQRPARNILEIGCGSGLLLHRLVKNCQRYIACDISRVALERIEKTLSKTMQTKVALVHTDALHFTRPDKRLTYDTVILNSVVQYFPDADYLARVLHQAIHHVGAQGQIVIGDVRDFSVVEAFYASIATYQAIPTAYQQATMIQWQQEELELLVHPDFFLWLKTQYPCIREVLIRHKTGDYQNDMMQYRFDVVLVIDKKHVVPSPQVPPSIPPGLTNTPQRAKALACIKQTLTNNLTAALPHYKVPSALIFLDKLPLNTNGKLDIAALPLPWQGSSQHVIRPPETPTQKRLLTIWRTVLGLQRISIDEDFFALGGHSLLALQLVHAVQQDFALTLPFNRLLHTNTIETLGAWLDTHVTKPTTTACTAEDAIAGALVCLQPTGDKPPLFLIHPIGGTVFCYYYLVQYLPKDRPIYAIQDPGIQAKDFLFNTLEEMAACYIDLIKTIQPTGPYLLGGSSSGGNIALEMLHQLTQTEAISGHYLFAMDSWAKLSDAFYSQTRLKKAMMRQYRMVNERLQGYNIKNPKPWLALHYHRMQLMAAYQTPMIGDAVRFILLKASALLPEYRDLDHPSNYWARYLKNQPTVYHVEGDHETMLLMPAAEHLGQQLTAVLSTITLNKKELSYVP